MADDWFVVAIQAVTEAGLIACESVESSVRALENGRQARLSGLPVSEIVDGLIAAGGRDVRMGAAEAFRRYEQAIQSMRVAVIRAMVDEEGLSLTEASRRLRVSRQAGARLYRSGGRGPVGT